MNYCDINRLLMTAHEDHVEQTRQALAHRPLFAVPPKSVIKLRTKERIVVWAEVDAISDDCVISARVISAGGHPEDHGLFKGSGISVNLDKVISVN